MVFHPYGLQDISWYINHNPPVLPGDPSAQVKRLRLVPVPGTPSRRSPTSRRTPSSSGRRKTWETEDLPSKTWGIQLKIGIWPPRPSSQCPKYSSVSIVIIIYIYIISIIIIYSRRCGGCNPLFCHVTSTLQETIPAAQAWIGICVGTPCFFVFERARGRKIRWPFL